jgi:hypothetical protein
MVDIIDDSYYNDLLYQGPNSLVMNGTNGNVYTQIRWAKTSAVGCAVAHCPGYKTSEEFFQRFFSNLAIKGVAPRKAGRIYAFMACAFSPAGNVKGRPIYQIGDTATNCPAGSTAYWDFESIYAINGLCDINGGGQVHA